ncbi:MAG: hypothetical protein OHK0012_21840 [Synechococcales cyanobacterium]
MTLASLLAFSQNHCVAICATLVTVMTLISLIRLGAVIRLLRHGWSASPPVWLLPGCDTVLVVAGGLLIAHVASWWWSGVVMLPTYLLPGVVGLYLGFAWSCSRIINTRLGIPNASLPLPI